MSILEFWVLDNDHRIKVTYDSSITFEEFALDYLIKHCHCPTLDRYEFVFRHKILNSKNYINKTLKELIIENRTIKLKSKKILAGGAFLFGTDNKDGSNEEILVKGNYGKDAPKWNVITTGLNVRGKCENSSCEAYNKRVDCQIGLGIFDIQKDYNKIKCPMCKNGIHPLACYFCKCQYKIEGKKYGENIEVSKPWKTVEKDFEYYDPEKKGITEWSTLIIETKPL